MDILEKVPAIEDVESEVLERLEVFVRAYVSEFETKLEEYAKEAEVGGSGKTGKTTNALSAATSSAPGLMRGVVSFVEKGWKYFSGKTHRRRAKKVTQIFQTVKTDDLRKMFVEAASLIYYSFQSQFESVTDADGNWKRALSKLAIDARNRSISYIYNEETTVAIEALSNDLLTKAVILGESKDSLISHVTPKKMQQIIPGTKPGHTLKNESKEWKTSDIYEKVGIKIVGSNGQTKYYKKKMCGNDYGYRWGFNWENDRSRNSKYVEEDCRNVPEDIQTLLKLEELEAKTVQILANINIEDPKWQAKDNKLQSDRIEDGVDTVKADIVPIKQDISEIKTKLSLGLSQSDQPKIFIVTPPVKTFTGRERELTQLHDKLQTHQNQVVVSQCASISGLGGMGKSELARKYAHTYHEYYGSCIWIDSETQSSITQSFHRLAEKLQIPIMHKSSDSEKSVERNILLIVEDIYKRFSNSKSLFIFDNVNQYEDIKDFLPSSLSPTDEKPTIIITSRNSDWDIGDEGDVGLILLDQFTPEEALSFVKKVLEIKDEDTSHDSSISELTEELCYFPLALRQAASYIKEKKCLASYIKAIKNYLGEFRDEKKKRDLLQYKTKRDRYTETTYTTWLMTFRNMEKDEANGSLAIRLVEVMAYLPADNIPITGFKGLAENKEKLKGAVDILLKYSIITVKEWIDQNDEDNFFYHRYVANIHRLVQQVIRLWIQDQEREKDVLGMALIKVHDYYDTHFVATLWTYLCDYTTLINKYFCKIDRKPKSYAYYTFTYVLNKLVTDGDTRTVRKILNYFEGRDDLWREISYDILNRDLVQYKDINVSMENTTHETHIKAVLIFHAEVFNALKHSNTKELELFLQSFDKSLINSRFNDVTALENSSFSGNLNVVKILVENGADVNSPLSFRITAVQVALNENHLKVMEYLLDHGADSNPTNNKCRTVLESASYHGNLSIVKRFVDTIAKSENSTEVDCSPLHLAARNDHVEIVEFLTNHEVYRSAMKDHGQTSCSVAAANGSIQVVKYLIENKLANVNGRDCNNETLLIAAAEQDEIQIVKYLLTDKTHDKVEINACNVLGCTPLLQEVLYSNIEIVGLLIEHGAAVENVKNGKSLLRQLNISALHFAATCDFHLDIVRLLVEKCNADINMGLNTTFSPLQVAKYFDSEEVCRFLIRNGADTTEWCEDNFDNVTRIIRSFCQENNSAVDYMFSKCYLILDYIKNYSEMHYEPNLLKERLEILHSWLDGLKLDMTRETKIRNLNRKN